MDDDKARVQRAPLWKRAIWQALKSLVREHPGAALSAAGSGAGYAVRQGMHEGAEAIGEKFADVREALTPEPPRAGVAGKVPPVIDGEVLAREEAPSRADPADAPFAAAEGPPAVSRRLHDMTDAEKKELIDSLSPKDRRQLAALAAKSR
jgi:hypothetical protein